MSLGKSSLSYIAPLRQKQHMLQAEKKPKQQQRRMFDMNLPLPPVEANLDFHVSHLQQGISAYLDAVQMVCKAGSWVAEALFVLLDRTQSERKAKQIRDNFSDGYKQAIDINAQAKFEFAQLLMNLTLLNNNSNNHNQVTNWKNQNAKILEKCLIYLKDIHNTVFCGSSKHSQHYKNIEEEAPKIVEETFPTDQLLLEWNQLLDAKKCCNSWKTAKQMTESLRKSSGLTESEIQNLLKTSSVSDSYIKKLNSRISSGLKNYESTIRGLALPLINIPGGFHIAPREAKKALHNCCNTMEMEQGVERLSVSQFLHCELPLIHFKIFENELLPNSADAVENAQRKKKAVSRLVQTTNPKLSLSETESLTCEILGDICPARWRSHVKATLQLLFGNVGLVVLDTCVNDQKQKDLPTINRKSSTIVIVIPSTWSIKEDPGTMIMLHREVDPEKIIMNVQARYVAVYNIIDAKLEPGIFVEVSLRNAFGRKRNTFVSTSFWLDNFSNAEEVSAIKTSKEKLHGTDNEFLCTQKSVLVQEDKKDVSKDESDTEEAVQDAIKLLSGSFKIRNAKSAVKMELESNEETSESPKHETSTIDIKGKMGKSDVEKTSIADNGQQRKGTNSDLQSKSNSLPSAAQTKSTSSSRKNYGHRHSSPKSASFSAFDKSTRMHIQKPVIFVRNAQLGTTSAVPGNGYLQNNQAPNSTIFLQPGLTNFQPHTYQTVVSQCVPADAGVLQRGMYIQSHLQNLRQCQLTRSPSPVTFMRSPHPAVLSTPPEKIAQTLLKSQSASDLAALQSLQLQQQQIQQQLLHQSLLMKTSSESGISDVHSTNTHGPNTMFQHNMDRQLCDKDEGIRQMPVGLSADNTSSKNIGQDQLQEMYYASQVKLVKHRLDEQSTALLTGLSHQPTSHYMKGGELFASSASVKADDLGPIGSPVTARRREQTNDEAKGSNTWPFLKRQSEADCSLSADESEYAKYVAGIKNVLQRKTTDTNDESIHDNHPRTWSYNDSQPNQADSSFNIFSTPNLVQHIIPSKAHAEERNDLENGNKGFTMKNNWQPWHVWQTSENNDRSWEWKQDDQVNPK